MKTIQTLIDNFITFINTTLVPLVFAVAFIVFLFGVYRAFIAGGASDEKRAEGRKYVMWAIIGFAIMTSVWGLVNLVTGSFSFDQTRPCLPTFTGACDSSTGATTNTTGTVTTPAPVKDSPDVTNSPACAVGSTCDD